MKKNMKCIPLIMLLFCFFVNRAAWALSGSNQVKVDGDRLSVHVEGVVLRELLAAIGDMTEIQFRFDNLAGERKIFLDLKSSPLSDGIRKIVYHLNSAIIYDDSGEVDRVYVMGKSTDSAMTPSRGGAHYASGDMGSYCFEEGSSVDELYSGEESSDVQDPELEDPPDLLLCEDVPPFNTVCFNSEARGKDEVSLLSGDVSVEGALHPRITRE